MRFFGGMALIALGVSMMLSADPPDHPFYQAALGDVPDLPPGFVKKDDEIPEDKRKKMELKLCEWEEYISRKANKKANKKSRSTSSSHSSEMLPLLHLTGPALTVAPYTTRLG